MMIPFLPIFIFLVISIPVPISLPFHSHFTPISPPPPQLHVGTSLLQATKPEPAKFESSPFNHGSPPAYRWRRPSSLPYQSRWCVGGYRYEGC